MSASVLDMSMSLDGYVADPNDFLGGDDGERLHKWADGRESGQLSGPAEQFRDEWNAAGAVLAGRRTAELMDHWGGDHEGLPIFVPSHRPPGPAARWGYPLVTYVTDGIESAMAQAKAAAGDRDVQVRGGATRRNGRSRPGCWTRCRSIRSRCCSAGAPAVRRAAVAGRVGDRPGDRHSGRHPYPLPHPSLTMAELADRCAA